MTVADEVELETVPRSIRPAIEPADGLPLAFLTPASMVPPEIVMLWNEGFEVLPLWPTSTPVDAFAGLPPDSTPLESITGETTVRLLNDAVPDTPWKSAQPHPEVQVMSSPRSEKFAPLIDPEKTGYSRTSGSLTHQSSPHHCGRRSARKDLRLSRQSQTAACTSRSGTDSRSYLRHQRRPWPASKPGTEGRPQPGRARLRIV